MNKFHDKSNKYVAHVKLRVEDLERSLKFYKDIMGFKVLEEDESKALLTVDGITPLLTLTTSEKIIVKIPRRTGLYHFALLLPSRLDLGLFLKNIREKKYPLVGGSNHGVSEAIYLQDPDDNGIEIYADTDSNNWAWENNKVKMISIPLDYKSLLEKGETSKWQGMPKSTIIGHIHLHVSNLDKAKEFYVEGLGFDVVMKMENSALFLSSGGYHHHIGLNTWNGVGAKSLPKNSSGMEYYTIVFPDEDNRKDAINRLKNLGYKIIVDGPNFYTKDPSDNLTKLII